jgi:kumamolisin
LNKAAFHDYYDDDAVLERVKKVIGIINQRSGSSDGARRDGHWLTANLFLAFAAIVLAVSLSFGSIASNAAPSAKTLGMPAKATLVGRTAATSNVSISIVLPLRNQAELTDLTKRLYDRTDPVYGHYLTPQEFNSRFSPSQDDIDAVSNFAASHSLSVDKVSANGTIIRLSGHSSDIEGAFGVHLFDYADSTGRVFRSPDRAPMLSADLASRVVGVIGLDTRPKLQPYIHQVSKPTAEADQGPAYSVRPPFLSPADVQSIYGLTVSNTSGAGQTVGLFEADGWTATDMRQYELKYGLPKLYPKLVSVDGGTNQPMTIDGTAETTLDCDMVLALAPGIAGIDIYVTGDNSPQGFVDDFNQMATDDKVNVVSVSYGISEFLWAGQTVAESGEAIDYFTAANQALEQMAVQGQTVCVASGDAGAYADQQFFPLIPNTSEPASEPFVTAVGGTDMTDTSAEAYASESSWADKLDSGRGLDGTGGGGGVSTIWTIPSYQIDSFNQLINMQGSVSNRNVPDVSLYGDYDTGGYWIYLTFPAVGSYWAGYNGTSAASPLWAGFLADVNSERVADSESVLGFANPAIYQIADNPTKYASDFHDVNDGSNNLFYTAVPGYDNSTGWGSFVGNNLSADLVAAYPSIVPTSVTFAPNQVAVGQPTTVTVVVSAPAQLGGIEVPITANGATFATVKVKAGTITASATYTPTIAGPETFTAAYNGVSVSGVCNVVSALALSSIEIDPMNEANAQGVFNVISVVPPSIPATNTTPAVLYPVDYYVSLNAAAPAGGATVQLSYTGPYPSTLSNPTGTVPIGTITFNPGETTAWGSFHSPWNTVGSTTTPLPGESPGNYIVTATLGNSTATASMPVLDSSADPVLSMSFSPQVVEPGAGTIGTVLLATPAPSAGEPVYIFEGTQGAPPWTAPGDEILIGELVIPSGKTGAQFGFTASLSGGTYYFDASEYYDSAIPSPNLDNSYGNAILTVLQSSGVLALSVPTSVAGGSTATGTVTLGAVQSTATTVYLTTDSPLITIPATVVIPAGSLSGYFSIVTAGTATAATTTITAGVSWATAFTYMIVRPSFSATVSVSAPSSVYGDHSTTGTVNVSPTPVPSGTVVTLTSSDPSLLSVPKSITIPVESGTNTFTITANNASANTPVTITATLGASTSSTSITVLPFDASVSIPTSIIGDQSATGTLTLNTPAPPGGATVKLSSSSSLITLPASVTFAAGATTATFNLAASNTATATAVTVTSSIGAASESASITVEPFVASSITLPSAIYGDHPTTGSITLNAAAPAAGVVVKLSSSSVLVSVPTSVTVPSGSTTATFNVTTTNDAAPTAVTISATVGPTAPATTQITVDPYAVQTVILPASLPGTVSGTGSVTLNTTAPPAGTVVTLSSSSTPAGIVGVPASVTVPGGSNTASFTITTENTSTSVIATVTATIAPNKTSSTITVLPSIFLKSITVPEINGEPNELPSGALTTATATLSEPAPAGGAVVTLSTSATSLATVEPSVTIPAGQTSATFGIATAIVSADTPVTITGTYVTTVQQTFTIIPE